MIRLYWFDKMMVNYLRDYVNPFHMDTIFDVLFSPFVLLYIFRLRYLVKKAEGMEMKALINRHHHKFVKTTWEKLGGMPMSEYMKKNKDRVKPLQCTGCKMIMLRE